jgi:hypothetical protein
MHKTVSLNDNKEIKDLIIQCNSLKSQLERLVLDISECAKEIETSDKKLANKDSSEN